MNCKIENVCSECQKLFCKCTNRVSVKRLTSDIYFHNLEEGLRIEILKLRGYDPVTRLETSIILENNWHRIPFYTLVLMEYKDDLDINLGVDKENSV